MGTIQQRGTKDRPRFYIRYVDIDGVRRCRAVKGAVTKTEAQRVLNAHELKVASDRAGIVEDIPSIQAQLDAQSEMLAHALDLLAKLADNLVYMRDKPIVEAVIPPTWKPLYRLRNALKKYSESCPPPDQSKRNGPAGFYKETNGRYRIDFQWLDVHTQKRERVRHYLPKGTSAAEAEKTSVRIMNMCVSGFYTNPKESQYVE